jgi:putative flavoprotein involved in K+ transport
MADYAQHFNLDIRHNVQVNGIRKAIDGWRISTEGGETWVSEHVIIATGFNRVPYLPRWEEQDAYRGTLLHAVEYQTGRIYAGKRVLVIGSGNTATEICVDLLEQGVKDLTISIHSFPTIVPRDPFGVPIQVWGLILFPLPRTIKDAIVSMVARLQLGDLSRYGLHKPEWRVFGDGRIPTIDVGFVDALKQGKIKIAGKIQHFTVQGVTFEDGNTHEFDAVIAATGYRTGLQDLLDIPDVVHADGSLLVTCGEPNHHAGLWFVGLENSPAGLLLAARVQSRNLAKHIARQLGIKA